MLLAHEACLEIFCKKAIDQVIVALSSTAPAPQPEVPPTTPQAHAAQ